MKFVVTIILSLLMLGNLAAQARFGTTNGVDEILMSGHDFVQFDQNEKKLFWAVDLNIFTATQKTTFQEMVFNSQTLIAVSTPDANNYWYLASYKTYATNDVILELNKMIEKAKTLTTNSTDKYQ